MPWRCPACRTEIRHNAVDTLPNPTNAYRCHVCRLDLRFDPTSQHMVVAPFDGDDDAPSAIKQPQRIPIPRSNPNPKDESRMALIEGMLQDVRDYQGQAADTFEVAKKQLMAAEAAVKRAEKRLKHLPRRSSAKPARGGGHPTDR